MTFGETVGWLKAAEKSFDFWINPADALPLGIYRVLKSDGWHAVAA